MTRKYGVADTSTITVIKDTAYSNLVGVSCWAFGKFALGYDKGKYSARILTNKIPSGKYSSPTEKGYICGNTDVNYYLFVPSTEMTSQEAQTLLRSLDIVYELATPTTETAEPYQNPQTVDNWGTEEYVTNTIVPVGHNTKYLPDLKAKLETLPNPPTSDGEYIVKQTSGENAYIALASSSTIQNIIARIEALENA